MSEADPFKGIFTCLLLLLCGTVLSFLLRQVYKKYPNIWELPDPWLYFVLGLVIALILNFSSSDSHLADVVLSIDAEFPLLFFAVILPTVVFESGITLDSEQFMSSFTAASFLAGPGTIVSSFVVATLLYFVVSWGFLDCLIFGTIISATDTVSVLSTLDPTIKSSFRSLLYGESILNDVVVIVLCKALVSLRTSGITLGSIFFVIIQFFITFILSSGLGFFIAIVAAILFKFAGFRSNSLSSESTITTEKTLYILLPFLAYTIAEAVSLSGVVSILFTGIFFGKITIKNVAAETREFSSSFFAVLSQAFESLVFVYLGIAAPSLGSSFMASNWYVAVLLVVFCIAGRFAGVFLSSYLVNRLPHSSVSELQSSSSVSSGNVPLSLHSSATSERVDAASRLFLCFAAPRGGVSFALAALISTEIAQLSKDPSNPSDPPSKELADLQSGFPALALFVGIVSLFVIPPLIGPLSRRLRLLEPSPSAFDHMSPAVLSSLEEDSSLGGGRGGIRLSRTQAAPRDSAFSSHSVEAPVSSMDIPSNTVNINFSKDNETAGESGAAAIPVLEPVSIGTFEDLGFEPMHAQEDDKGIPSESEEVRLQQGSLFANGGSDPLIVRSPLVKFASIASASLQKLTDRAIDWITVSEVDGPLSSSVSPHSLGENVNTYRNINDSSNGNQLRTSDQPDVDDIEEPGGVRLETDLNRGNSSRIRQPRFQPI